MSKQKVLTKKQQNAIYGAITENTGYSWPAVVRVIERAQMGEVYLPGTINHNVVICYNAILSYIKKEQQ